MANLSLRPIHYASVSGGKDSLFMLKLILAYPDKYPLDMVVNYDLEIEWDWEKRVVDYIESECNKHGIKFIRIKPRKDFDELGEKYGSMPTRVTRWCNSKYKLDCARQLLEWIKSQSCRPLAYIGLCADETKRFKYDIGNWKDQDICYPIAEEGINEDVILEWAKKQPIFGGWYAHFRRGGCMCCPLATRKEMAYLIKTEPKHWEYFKDKIRRYEKEFSRPWMAKKYVDDLEKFLIKKYFPIIDEESRYEQMELDLGGENG